MQWEVETTLWGKLWGALVRVLAGVAVRDKFDTQPMQPVCHKQNTEPRCGFEATSGYASYRQHSEVCVTGLNDKV